MTFTAIMIGSSQIMGSRGQENGQQKSSRYYLESELGTSQSNRRNLDEINVKKESKTLTNVLKIKKEKTDFDKHRECNNKTQNDMVELNDFTPAKYVKNSTLTKALESNQNAQYNNFKNYKDGHLDGRSMQKHISHTLDKDSHISQQNFKSRVIPHQ